MINHFTVDALLLTKIVEKQTHTYWTRDVTWKLPWNL